MVGVGMLMLAVSWAGLWWAWWRRWQPERLPRRLLWVLAGMTFSGWVATVAGWYVTEIGRQPWLVQGVLLARDAVAAHAPAHVGLTLVAYLVTYTLLLIAFVGTLFYLAKKEIASAP